MSSKKTTVTLNEISVLAFLCAIIGTICGSAIIAGQNTALFAFTLVMLILSIGVLKRSPWARWSALVLNGIGITAALAAMVFHPEEFLTADKFMRLVLWCGAIWILWRWDVGAVKEPQLVKESTFRTK